MESGKMCYICQNYKTNIGHETKWCPMNICKKCGKKGHTRIGCMAGMEEFPLPNNVLYKIAGYLSPEDISSFSKVSTKMSEVCQIDKILKNMLDFPKEEKSNDAIPCNSCADSIDLQQYYHCPKLQCTKRVLCNTCFDSQGKLYFLELAQVFKNK